jgi:hypothetical protein
VKAYGRMIVLLVGAIATALILQGAFDASDHGKAERAVRGYRVGDGPALGERVEKEAPGGGWTTEITHGCRGIVEVSYRAPDGRFVFEYDVPQHAIHPGNDAAARILSTLPPSAPRPR